MGFRKIYPACSECGLEPATARKGGLGSACRSWHAYVNNLSDRRLLEYAERFNIRLDRAMIRVGLMPKRRSLRLVKGAS